MEHKNTRTWNTGRWDVDVGCAAGHRNERGSATSGDATAGNAKALGVTSECPWQGHSPRVRRRATWKVWKVRQEEFPNCPFGVWNFPIALLGSGIALLGSGRFVRKIFLRLNPYCGRFFGTLEVTSLMYIPRGEGRI